MKTTNYMIGDKMYCMKNSTIDMGDNKTEVAPLWKVFCETGNCTVFWDNNEVSLRDAIPGLNYKVFLS